MKNDVGQVLNLWYDMIRKNNKIMKETNINKGIYLDHAAATPVLKEAYEAMMPYYMDYYANAGAIHQQGLRAKSGIDDARRKIALVLGCNIDEVIFTSGGTESNNLAIFGLIRALRGRKPGYDQLHVISSEIEHVSVRRPLEVLEEEGLISVTWLPVNGGGTVASKDLAAALRDETVLVSIIYGHNEIGTVQDIPSLAKVISGHRKSRGGTYPLFHIDGAQAVGNLELLVEKLHVDMMTISSSKCYGPKGAAALYARRRTPLVASIWGGGHEYGLRSGTQNTPSIVGFGEAVGIVHKDKERMVGTLRELREWFRSALLSIPGTISFGDVERSLPGILNMGFAGVMREQLVLELDARKVSISAGSACDSKDNGISHTLRALNAPESYSRGAVRFSLGRSTNLDCLKYVVSVLPDILGRIRS